MCSLCTLCVCDVSRAGKKTKPEGGKQPAAEDDGFTAAGGRGKRAGGRKAKADPSLLGFSVESSRIMQGEIQFVEGM